MFVSGLGVDKNCLSLIFTISQTLLRCYLNRHPSVGDKVQAFECALIENVRPSEQWQSNKSFYFLAYAFVYIALCEELRRTLRTGEGSRLFL